MRTVLVIAALGVAACGSNNGSASSNNGGATNNGTAGSNNGTAASNNGTAGSNNGTAASNNGTAAGSNNGTVASNNGTASTNNQSTSGSNNGSTSASNNGTPGCDELDPAIGPCDPICQTGCGADEHCVLDGATIASTCGPAGAGENEAICETDADCGVGLHCRSTGGANPRCLYFCDGVSPDCPDSYECIRYQGEQRLGVCILPVE